MRFRSGVLLFGIELRPCAVAGDRIQFPLPAIEFVQPFLEFGSRGALIWFSPCLTDSLRTLDNTVVFRAARRIEHDADSQARQPASKVGRQVALRTRSEERRVGK